MSLERDRAEAIAAALGVCGLSVEAIGLYAHPGGAREGNPSPLQATVGLRRGSAFTYDILARVAKNLGTTDINVKWIEGFETEVTFEPDRVELIIALPDVLPFEVQGIQ